MKVRDLVRIIEKVSNHCRKNRYGLLGVFDVPGCGSTGDTKEEVERNIQEAIEFHLEGLREEGYEIPEPSTYSSYIDIAA